LGPQRSANAGCYGPYLLGINCQKKSG